jgi:hypothetical protein
MPGRKEKMQRISLLSDYNNIIGLLRQIDFSSRKVRENQELIRQVLEESIINKNKNIELLEEFSVLTEIEDSLVNVWTAVSLYLNIVKCKFDISDDQKLLELHKSVIKIANDLVENKKWEEITTRTCSVTGSTLYLCDTCGSWMPEEMFNNRGTACYACLYQDVEKVEGVDYCWNCKSEPVIGVFCYHCGTTQ